MSTPVIFWSEVLQRLFTPEQAVAIIRSISLNTIRSGVIDELVKAGKEVLQYEDPNDYRVLLRFQPCVFDWQEIVNIRGQRQYSFRADGNAFVLVGRYAATVALFKQESGALASYEYWATLGNLTDNVSRWFSTYLASSSVEAALSGYRLKPVIGLSVTIPASPNNYNRLRGWHEAPLFLLFEKSGNVWDVYPGIRARFAHSESVSDSVSYAIGILCGAAAGDHYTGGPVLRVGKFLEPQDSQISNVCNFVDLPLISSFLQWFIDDSREDNKGLFIREIESRYREVAITVAIQKLALGLALVLILQPAIAGVLGELGIGGAVGAFLARGLASLIATYIVEGTITREQVYDVIASGGFSALRESAVAEWLGKYGKEILTGLELGTRAVMQYYEYRELMDRINAASEASDTSGSAVAPAYANRIAGQEYALMNYLFQPVLGGGVYDEDTLVSQMMLQGGNLL